MGIFGYMNLKNQIEALLFLTDEPIHAQVIAQRVNVDINEVRQALSQLMQDYETRDGGLCIESYDGYILNVKAQYDTLVEEFLPLDIKTGCLRTLSAIALKEPVAQADLVKMRGGGAYEQIKELLEMELITRKRENGHSFVLKTTKLFHDYFKLSGSGIELQDFLKGKSRRFKQPEQETFDLSSTEKPEASEEENTTESDDTSLRANEESEAIQETTEIVNETEETSNESFGAVLETLAAENSFNEEDDELKEVANQLAANVEETEIKTEAQAEKTEMVESIEAVEESSLEIQIKEPKEDNSVPENNEAPEKLEITAN